MPVSNREELGSALAAELLPLSPGLVYDPVSLGPDPAPLEIELDAIERRLRAAARRTATLRTTRVVRPRTADLVRGLRHGIAAARTARRIVSLPVAPLSRAGIRALIRRAESVLRDAQIATRRIERARPFRDRPVPGQQSLFQQQDLPRLERLRDVRARAANALAHLRDMAAAATTAAADPAHVPDPPEPAPLRPSGAKDLPALYERWLMLRVVRALSDAGFRGDTIHDALAPTGSEYLADFDSDRAVRFEAGEHVDLVLRFEPWIHPLPLATGTGSALYRPGDSLHSWRPDLLIQLEHTAIAPDSPAGALAAIVIDAKLGPVIGLEQWQQVRKYHDIRATHDHRAIVRRVCIATPGRLAAAPSDIARDFGVVPDLLALSPLDEHRVETRSELERLVAFVEEMVTRTPVE